MNKSFQVRFLGAALLVLVLVSESHSIPSAHNFRRFRRDAEAEAEPEPATTAPPISVTISAATPSLPFSSSSPASPHDSHNVQCDGDNSELKKSCPDSNTCPKDEKTMEQCCHCLNTCCGNAPMTGMREGSGEYDDSTAEPEPETSTGGSTQKGIGGKVKDAVSSAEGWIKNAGQNIKNSWDKAKEGIKNTASDVKEKVKKGINSVTNKMRNSTGGAADNGTAACKDGKCNSTDMPINDDDVSSGESSDSDEDSSPSSVTTTKTPGQKKMKKREVYGVGNNRYPAYPSSSIYGPGQGTRYTSGMGGFDNSDSSGDSNEYTWTKTVSQTGSRDFNHRYMRSTGQQKEPEMNSKSPNIPESPSTESSNSSSSRNKRAAQMSSATEYPGRYAENCTSKMEGSRQRRQSSGNQQNTGTTKEVSTSSSMSTNEQNDKSGSSSGSRNRRSSMMDATTKSPMEESTSGKTDSKSRSRRDAIVSTGNPNTDSTMAPMDDMTNSTEAHAIAPEDSKEESVGKQNDNRGNMDKSQQSNKTTESSNNGNGNTSFSISVNVTTPQEESPSRNDTISISNSTSNSNSSNSGNASSSNAVPGRREGNGSIRFPPFDPPTWPRSNSHSRDQMNSQVDPPPIIQFPDGSGSDLIFASPNSDSNANNTSNNSSNNTNTAIKYGFYGNGMMNGGGGHRRGVGNIGGPSYQQYPSEEEYSQYYPILEGSTAELTTSASSWSPSSSQRMGGWESWGSGSSLGGGGSTDCKDDHQPGDYYHPHDNQPDHYHKNKNDCEHGNHYNGGGGGGSHYIDDGGKYGGATLGSGSLNLGDDYNSYDDHGHHDQTNVDHNGDQGYHNSHTHYRPQQDRRKSHNNRGTDKHDDSTWGNGVISSGDAEGGTPGQCRPLAGRAKCASLRPDSAQCLYDTDCSGTKKCCFYNCDPNKVVGICEYVTYTVTKA